MPRKYTRTTMRAKTYTKEALNIAIQKIKNKELTYAAASKVYGIPSSTLSDRVRKKTATISNTLGRSTTIPIHLEIKLANCLRTIEKWGWGLSRQEILDLTQEFVKKNKIYTPFKDGRPGPDWFISFRQRHNLSIKKPQPVQYLRKKMTDPFIIHQYFTLLEKTLLELNLTDPKRIWNLDETSVCLDPSKTKVVGARGEPCTRTTCGSAKENITVLTTVNAAGEKLDPLIIFKGKHMYEQWMLQNPENYDFDLAYAASQRGWIETDIFFNYMSNIIIPHLGEERPVLLLYDGHVSHVDEKVVTLAVENNITIIKLPAHTSHLLQPLDLAVFKSFKAIWDKNLVKWQRQNVGIKLRKQYFAKLFADAWKETKTKTIQNGSKKGGIYPFDANVIPKVKFDPKVYSRFLKHMSTTNVNQPKTLKQLCINELNKNIHPRALESEETSSELLNTSFENLLLEKVAQYSKNNDNNTSLKLKRIAKGAEVITKTLVQKQKDREINRMEEKETIKPGQTNKKTKNIDAKPGPSRIHKKHTNTKKTSYNCPILSPKTNSGRYYSTKGKGTGKKSKTDNKNINCKDLVNDKENNKIEDICSTNLSTRNLLLNDSKVNKNSNNVCNFENNPNKKNILKRSVRKRNKHLSPTTTVESVQMSIHSDSDLLDSLRDIISDCDIWSTTICEENTDLELLSREQQIEQILKEIREDDISNDKNIQQEHLNNANVTLLSAAKGTPENQAFYNTNLQFATCKQFEQCDKRSVKQKQKITETKKEPYIPKKKTKVNHKPNKTIIKDKTDTDKCINTKYSSDNKINVSEHDNTELRTYKVGDTVLVRYYKKQWTHYVGVVENNNNNTNSKQYTISYFKSIGKRNNLKFIFPKRKDQDYVPEYNIVKEIELLQIKEDPVEYVLMNDDDEIFF